jgi:hypothetical protein
MPPPLLLPAVEFPVAETADGAGLSWLNIGHASTKQRMAKETVPYIFMGISSQKGRAICRAFWNYRGQNCSTFSMTARERQWILSGSEFSMKHIQKHRGSNRGTEEATEKSTEASTESIDRQRFCRGSQMAFSSLPAGESAAAIPKSFVFTKAAPRCFQETIETYRDLLRFCRDLPRTAVIHSL